MKLLRILVFLLFAGMLLGQCDESYTEIDGNCYYQSDLDVIDTFIQNSPEINLILDTNNNGVIESLEFCQQIWSENGRLQILDCGPIIINGNYNWLEISGEIPGNITNWNQIEVLKIPYNNLYGLVPDNICQLNLNFNQPNIFNFQGNDLCPPYPECVEDYMGMQNNFGTDFCELGNCYDLGISQMTIIELDGDNIVNPYYDTNGVAHLLITMHNDGPDCSTYPGLMITSNVEGTSFPIEPTETSVNWWYAIPADYTYFANIAFDISSYIPLDTEITIIAETVIMGCLDEGCSEDAYCHDCPLTEPMSIPINIGDTFPSRLGDANIDGIININDVVLTVSFILSNIENYYQEYNGIEIYLSDINQDYNINVLDILILIQIILDA